MCRVRNQHTGPPWTTAYICMTIDESCTDEDGKYVDKPFIVRMVEWQPYCVVKDFAQNLHDSLKDIAIVSFICLLYE